MRINRRYLLLISISLGFTACNPVEENQPQPYESGVVVINEGGFGKGNGSLSFISRESTTTLLDIFNKENNKSLGDVVQSYAEFGDKGMAVVNNSNKIEVVNARTFKNIATLTDRLTQPRYLAYANGKAYVTCWDKLNADYSFKTGWVTVVDLVSNQTLATIPVGKGPEKIIVIGGEVFISNTDENTLSVINTTTDVVSRTVVVGDNPNDLLVDANGKLWVLCKGKFGDKSEMVRLNPITKTIEARLTIGSHPVKKAGNLTLSTDKQTIYFTYNFYDATDSYKHKGEVYSFRISDASIPATVPIASKPFYGLGFDNQNNVLYGAIVPSFSQSGYVYRYRTSGQLIDSLKVEIGPNGFFFK